MAESTEFVTGFSEIFKRGWMLCNSETDIFIDSTKLCTGKSSLCIRGGARKRNGCVAKLKVNTSRISPQGFSFNIQGSGRICLRYRYNDKEWQYLDLNTLKESKSARYPLFLEKEWKKVIIRKMAEDNGSLDLEIRTGKGEPFCFWID